MSRNELYSLNIFFFEKVLSGKKSLQKCTHNNDLEILFRDQNNKAIEKYEYNIIGFARKKNARCAHIQVPHCVVLKVAWSEESRAGGGVPQREASSVRMCHVSATALIPLLVFLLYFMFDM